MNNHVEELHQARLKEIARTEAVLAELEALALSCEEEIEAPAQAEVRDRGDDSVQPMTLDELRRYGIPAMGAAQVTSVVAAPVPEAELKADGTEEDHQAGAGKEDSADAAVPMFALDDLLTENIIETPAPIETLIGVVIASAADETVAADAGQLPTLADCVSLEDEVSALEANLLAELVRATDAAQDYAAQASAIGVVSTSQPSWGRLAGQFLRGQRRSLQNRAAYEKKKPGARKYAKPLDMTDEERAAHEATQRKARKARELAQRKLKRAEAKVAICGEATEKD